MKNTILLLVIFFLTLSLEITAQCVQCEGGSATGTNASIIGTNNIASGNSSFAGGKDTEAIAKQSFAFGDKAQAKSLYSIALGKEVTAWGGSSVAIGKNLLTSTTSAMIIGAGFNDNTYRLKNEIPYSLMIGFNSSKPTFFVSESSGSSSTGKIGIGNVTAPQAKLHIREDDNYDTASIFIQASNIERSAYLWLGTKNYGLQKKSASLEFLTDGDYLFNQGNIKLDNHYQIEASRIQSNTKGGLSLFTNYNSGIFIDERGQVGINNTRPGATLDISGKLRTQSLQIPLANPLGEPKDIAGYVLQSRDNYGNVRWTPQSSLDDGDWVKDGDDVFHLDGQVGIGTTDLVGYKLTVAGKIRATEVMIEHIADWYDCVFEEDYQLTSLKDVESFVKQNKHLPDVPSEAEVKEKGINLGEMNAILLKKIEELTLHVIQQQKAMEKQQSELNTLQKQIETLINGM